MPSKIELLLPVQIRSMETHFIFNYSDFSEIFRPLENAAASAVSSSFFFPPFSRCCARVYFNCVLLPHFPPASVAAATHTQYTVLTTGTLSSCT